MPSFLAFALIRQRESLGFDLVYSGLIFLLLLGYLAWDRKFRRKFYAHQARTWQKVDGRFDEGEIITMRRARSNTIAGYEVLLGYEFEAEGQQAGVFFTPEVRDMADAEELLRRLANQQIPVRVCPGKPQKSRVLDQDIEFLTGGLKLSS